MVYLEAAKIKLQALIQLIESVTEYIMLMCLCEHVDINVYAMVLISKEVSLTSEGYILRKQIVNKSINLNW